MRLLVVLSLVALAVSAPPPRANYQTNNIRLLRYDNDNIGTGNYSFAFEQNDGTKHEQKGELRNEGRGDAFVVMTGAYSWVDPDGVTYLVTYTADENGYQPVIIEIEDDDEYSLDDRVAASLIG